MGFAYRPDGAVAPRSGSSWSSRLVHYRERPSKKEVGSAGECRERQVPERYVTLLSTKASK